MPLATAAAYTLCSCTVSDNGSFVTTSSSPNLNHVKSLLPGGAHDLLPLPLEGMSWEQHKKGQSLVEKSERQVVTPTHSRPHGADMILNNQVTTVQAYVRGHLTRKHIKPFKLQTKAATTIQAHW